MVLAHDVREREGAARRTADIATDSQVTFDTMLLAPRTLQGLLAAGFTKPSPVQLQGIPSGKCGFNLLLEAKSGTGKTAVFTVIALDMLNDEPDAEIMILAPTREIAAQIADVIKQIGSTFEGLQVEVVMGGLPLSEDVTKFAHKRKVHVIVGSPGRLRHLIEKRHIDTTSVRLFVLDEADKLMEGSFKADINYIFSSLPNCKQVIMSSATYPEPLKELIFKYMKKYIHICPNSTSILLGIEQRMTIVKQHDNNIVQTQLRYAELVKIFKSRQFKQCLIFCNYQARVVEIWKKLHADKWPAQYLHGKQDQMERLDALKTLQDYKCRILVSTDLAARGIDASNVDLVVNFEIPYEWTTYLHRIGRAGRYGSYGMAISLVAQGNEEKNFKKLICLLGGPVNIKPLWTDEAIDLNGDTVFKKDNNDKTREGTAISKSGPKLWDVINNKDDQNGSNDHRQVEIEDFDNLNESYDKADSFENFDDLLNSYEMNNVEKTKTAFKVLDVNGSKVTADVFLSFSNGDFKIKTNKVTNNKHTHMNDASSDYGENITIKHKIPSNTNNKREVTANSSREAKKNANFNDNCCLNNANLIVHNQNSRKALNRRESTHLHKEPRQGKISNCLDTTSSTLCDSVELNGNINSYPDIDWVPVAQCAYNTAQHTDHEDSSNHVHSSSESESEYTETSSSTCGSESSSEDEHLHWEEEDKNNHTYMSQNAVHKVYLQEAAKNYIIWKKQLAARRAHIQMAIYIEEMDKLT